MDEPDGTVLCFKDLKTKKVVVSIFVNPIQFGPKEDLSTYPRDLERDSKVCERAGANIIFHPENEEMYFNDFSAFVDMNGLTSYLI